MKSGLQTRCCGMRIPTSKHGELKCAYCLSCTANMFCFHGNVKFCQHGMYTLIERVTRAGLRALLSLYPFVPFHNFFLYNQWVRIYDRKLEYKSKMKLILLWNWFDYVYIYILTLSFSHYQLCCYNCCYVNAFIGWLSVFVDGVKQKKTESQLLMTWVSFSTEEVHWHTGIKYHVLQLPSSTKIEKGMTVNSILFSMPVGNDNY